MKNTKVIFIAMAVVFVLGIGAYALSQNSSQSESMMKNDETVMQKETQESMDKTEDESTMEKSEEKMMADNSTDSRYVEYAKATFEKAASNRRVLFFYASWCPTCRPADTNFKESMNKIPEDLTLIRVNYNDPETDQDEKDLAKKYGITYQHTFVQIDSKGKELAKWNGGKINELLTNIK